MSTFERYLTVWVALCIVAGIALGHRHARRLPCDRRGGDRQGQSAGGGADLAHDRSHAASRSTSPRSARSAALARHRRDAVHQLGRQAVLDGGARLALHRLPVPALSARRSDQQLYRRPDHPRGRALHRHGVRLVEPDQGRAAFHAHPGRAQRHHHGVRLRADRRPAARALRDHRAVEYAGPVGRALHRRAGDRRAAPSAPRCWRAAARLRSSGCSTGCSPLSLVALLATLVLLFGFQGEQILAQPLVIALLAVPILIQVYFNAGLAYLLNRLLGEQHCVAGPSALIGASQLLRIGGRRRHQPVRLQLRRGACDRRRRADRGAGHADGRLDREPVEGLVRARWGPRPPSRGKPAPELIRYP